jgi:methylaspartate mutase epsilon subunit
MIQETQSHFEIKRRGENMETEIRQKRIPENEFLEMRKEVLAQWPTGKEVDLKEAVEYNRSLPDSKNFMKVTQKLHSEGKTAVWPRAGTPVLEDEIELVKTLVKSGVRHVPVTTDSYTRNYQFEKAQQALEESIRTGKPMLNGFPIVNHGVKNTRKVIESVDAAFSPRGCVKLAMEIALASGMTAAGKSAFLEFGSYEKKRTLADCMAHTQYTNRLAGYYTERGAIITTDLHGFVPSGVFPLSVNIACMIVDALMAAEQGVKSVVPQMHCNGNMAQDIAWMRVTPRLMREYLDRFGYKDVVIPGILNNQIPLFPVPQGLGGAFAYLCYTAMTGTLGGSDAVFVRTIDEGAGVPTREAHTLSYEAANWLFNVLRTQKIEFTIKGIEEEERVTENEAKALLEKIIELGDGDVVVGSIKAVEAGFIDSPFCPNINVRDRVLGIRDSRGACRYLQFGNLPFSDEIKDFHREKVTEREKAEGRKMDYDVVIEDFWAFSRGRIIGV